MRTGILLVPSRELMLLSGVVMRRMSYWISVMMLLTAVLSGCDSAGQTADSNDQSDGVPPETVDTKVTDKFGEDDSVPIDMDQDSKAMVGNWYGKKDYLQIRMQLRADGTYKYFEYLGIGKHHNVGRVLVREGKWHLANGNSQLILELDDCEAPIILSNRYPRLINGGGVELSGGTGIDRHYDMKIDTEQDTVSATDHTDRVNEILGTGLRGKMPSYFTMVASKANSEEFWSAAGIKPPGYNYGHKIYKDFVAAEKEIWDYAKERNRDDPENYIIVISDESWTTFMGHRKNFEKAVLDPEKLYRWLFYWKTEMIILGSLPNGAIHIFAGDPPPYFMGRIRTDYDNSAQNVPAKIFETRFPEALELNPPQTFAGLFQLMDYIRMKYAPNVRMAYTLKEWGSQGLRDEEPEGGWDNDPDLQKMADEVNSFGVSWDYLAFNFNPSGEGGKRSDDIYKVRAKYFGTVAKKLLKRDGHTPAGAKVWIWKVSLWSNHPSFYFRNIPFLVNEANVAGMTLGHGNDWSGHSLGDYEDPAPDWPLKSWIEEYYTGVDKGKGGTVGKVYLP